MIDTCRLAPERPNWQKVRDYEDIRYEKGGGLAKITICRPEVRNAFRPKTLFELIYAFSRAREDSTTGVIIFGRVKATSRSAQAATSAYAATKATSATTACRA